MACLWLVRSLLHSKSRRCVLLLSVTQNPPLHSWLPLPTSLALVYHSSLLAIAWKNKSPLAERWHMFLGVNSGIRGLCTTPRKSEAPHKYLSKCLQICQWVCLGIRNDLFYPVWYVRCPELVVTQHPQWAHGNHFNPQRQWQDLLRFWELRGVWFCLQKRLCQGNIED